jgi:hypothetical protein
MKSRRSGLLRQPLAGIERRLCGRRRHYRIAGKPAIAGRRSGLRLTRRQQHQAGLGATGCDRSEQSQFRPCARRSGGLRP